jgi:hypothetical protein
MQMMPKINWPQRVAPDALAREPAALDVAAMIASLSPSPLFLFSFLKRRARALNELYQRWSGLPASFETQSKKNCLLQRKKRMRN